MQKAKNNQYKGGLISEGTFQCPNVKKRTKLLFLNFLLLVTVKSRVVHRLSQLVAHFQTVDEWEF